MAGEKNSKYKPEYDALAFSKPITIKDMKRIGSGRSGISCVYVFFDGETPVYVGKTVNSKRRFEPYLSASCHNEMLNEFIAGNRSLPIVRYIETDDIHNLERFLINKYKPTLFNIQGGGVTDWKVQSVNKKPWKAGAGIKCPSGIAISKVNSLAEKNEIKKAISSMTDTQRCLFEVGMAQDMINDASVNRWLDVVTPKMTSFLEGSL